MTQKDSAEKAVRPQEDGSVLDPLKAGRTSRPSGRENVKDYAALRRGRGGACVRIVCETFEIAVRHGESGVLPSVVDRGWLGQRGVRYFAGHEASGDMGATAPTPAVLAADRAPPPQTVEPPEQHRTRTGF